MAAKLAESDREALREREVGAIPAWYSPWGHLAFPSVVGLGIVTTCVLFLRDLEWYELLVVPVTFLASNAVEWRAHRNVLHRRTPGLTVLYDRHTPVHHMIFVTEDMAMRSRREFRLVLIPAYGILVILIMNLPIAIGLVLLGQRNLAALYVATAMLYVLSYEWLHLAYHLPPSSFIGRLRLVAALRRHHATHHDPALMQKWNFNVTFPIWDWVRRTTWKG